MFGGRSIQLARVFGIRVGANISWFVVVFFLIISFSAQYKQEFPGHDTQAFALAVVAVFGYALSILLHELGHAVVALASKIPVSRIDLWLFGGLATLDREPPTARTELAISAAGPAVTLVLAVASFAAGAAIEGTSAFWHTTTSFTYGPNETQAGAVLSYIALINGLVLIINLMPGLPLDGGRIAHALVWLRTGDRLSAGRFVARSGRLSGYVLGAAGIWLLVSRNAGGLGIFVAFVGFMLVSAARVDGNSEMVERLAALSVADVMDTQPVVMPAATKLDRALDDFFLRYRWDWFPVVDAMGHFLGLVSRERVEQVPEALRPGSTVDSVMATETRRSYGVGVDAPLDTLLGSEGLSRLGALMAVDADGVLRGVVTIEQVRRALRPVSHTA